MATKLADSLRQNGLGATVRHAAALALGRRAPDAFDEAHGTETSGITPLWSLRIDSSHRRQGIHYEPTNSTELETALLFLNPDPAAFTFIDLGCGKGRTLIVAARFGFPQMVGIEFAQELAAVAKRNMAICGLMNATILCADAAEYTFPDSNLIVYMFNPFREVVLQKVIGNLRRLTAADVYVIYKSTVVPDALQHSRDFVGLASPPTAPQMRIWKLRPVAQRRTMV